MGGENKYNYLIDEWKAFKINEELLKDKEEVDKCFKNYVDKIKNNKLILEDYAIKSDINCDYFCTFMEHKTSKIYGSSRAGNAQYFGIKKNEGDTYYISKKVHGEKVEEEADEKLATEKFSNILSNLKSLVTNKIDDDLNNIFKAVEEENIITSKVMLRKIVAMNNAGKFLYIYSDDMINVLYRFFIDNGNDLTNIKKNKKIVEKLKEIFNIRNENLENDILRLSHFLWGKFASTIDMNAKNIILHGAPGTGKTYMTEKSILNNLTFLNNQNIEKQYKLVQFHPSFGYEEFIDGIKPKSLNGTGGIQLELVNGIFKDMCIDAFKELILANKDKREPKKFYFVADEINRAELSRVFGELLLCLEEDKRLRFKDDKLIGTKIKTQNASLWQKEHAVVVLDKDGKITDTDEDSNQYYFGVPENLYFIGTMNDIDRSVDSFDMALRRRFVWKHYSYQKEVLEEHYFEKKGLENYLKQCEALNNYITSEKGFNLPEAYELGHYYFMNLKSFSEDSLKKLWDEKIASLLTEYLRVNFEGKELVEKLECTKKIFLNKKLGKNCQ